MATKVGRVKLNRNTMNELLFGGLGMDAVLAADANRIAAQARAIAPVASGDYQRSIRVQATTRNERGGTRRRVYQVVAGGGAVDYARLVELNNSVLARAMGASTGAVRKNR